MEENIRKQIISQARHIVIKIGSGVLTAPRQGVDQAIFGMLAEQIVHILSEGKEVVLVSSGAIAAGMAKLNMEERPKAIPLQQGTAAIGQIALIQHYERSFGQFSRLVAQILLTNEDLHHRQRFLNARGTLMTLLSYEVIPIINENDSVVVDEIKFGDNDYLAAQVINLVEADLLIILTDTDGLFDRDPRRSENASLISFVEEISPEIEKLASRQPGAVGTGGMLSKIHAAKTAAAFGVPTIVANGRTAGTLLSLFRGENTGTLFLPKKEKISSRKHWIAYSLKPSGTLILDEGARKAILRKGKSLLPSGVKRVEGEFKVGDAIRCCDEGGNEFARGLITYSAEEVEKIKGCKTSEIKKILGYKYYDEVIHRDNLVLIE